MSPYEGGVHGEIEAGPVDLGLIVTESGLGLAIDAPVLGQLRAAFDVLHDGTTKLTALSREGVPVLGLTNHSRLAGLQAEVEAKQLELDMSQARLHELEATLAEHDEQAEQRLAQAQSALGATQASLEQTDASKHQAEDELSLTRKTLAETEARLRRAQTELTASKAAFTDADVKLRTALAEGSIAGSSLDDAQTRFNQSQAELLATRKTLTDVEGRLKRLQVQHDMHKDEFDARAGATQAELAEVTARLQQAEVQQTLHDAELQTLRDELQRVTDEKETEAQRAVAVEVERDEALRQLQQAQDGGQSDVGRLTAELTAEKQRAADELKRVKGMLAKQVAAEKQRAGDELKQSEEMSAAAAASLAEKAATEKSRADRLEAQLKDEHALALRHKAELDEERTRREELVRDLAYIQSQVSDLSSTKGALVARVKQMNDRESRRTRTTAEMTDVLRTAEVVAADTKASARRFEARAQKLDDQVRGMQQEIVEWKGRAEVAENSVMMLGEQLTNTTRERDALKIDVGFFQKQIGAMQRAAAQEKLKPKK